MGEPAGVAHHNVELVAMHDQKSPAVGGLVDDMVDHFDAAELHAEKFAGEFVVIAGNEHHARALAHLAQQFLHDVVMGLRPIPARFEPPAVDDVADEEEFVGFVVLEKIQQQFGLAAARAEMNIGKEQRAVAGSVVLRSVIMLEFASWPQPAGTFSLHRGGCQLLLRRR